MSKTENWESGDLTYPGLSTLIAPWILGLFILVLSSVMFLQPDFTLSDKDLAQLGMVFLFPFIASCIMLYGLFATLRFKKYGRSHARLLANPGVLGGWLRMEVSTKLRIAETDNLMASLKCMYIFRSEGKKSVHKVWQLNRDIMAHEIKINDDRTSNIPVAMYIPYDSPGTSADYFWTLELKAKVAGPDYYAKFTVPVFKTEESTLEVPQEAIDIFGDAVAPQEDYISTSRAHVDVLPGGGLEITTPSARIWPLIIICTVFTSMFCLWVYGLLNQTRIPIVPTLFASALSALMILVTAWLLFGKRKVILQEKNVTLQARLLTFKRARTCPMTDVAAVHYTVGGRVNGVELYNVYININDKNKLISSGLNAGEARWLANVIHVHLFECVGKKIPLIS